MAANGRPRHPPVGGISSFATLAARRSRVSAHRIEPERRDQSAHVESRCGVANAMSRSIPMPRGSRTLASSDRLNVPSSGQPNPKSRSEEHTSELQSLMRNSYAVFCLKKKKHKQNK